MAEPAAANRRPLQRAIRNWRSFVVSHSHVPMPPMATAEPSEAYCLRLMEARVRIPTQVTAVAAKKLETMGLGACRCCSCGAFACAVCVGQRAVSQPQGRSHT